MILKDTSLLEEYRYNVRLELFIGFTHSPILENDSI
jgi:hypothetical protein